MPNRLADETSPYLLQHKDNPVAWYPWGDEALAKARNENKPIFLSIGYSACHWCHVMEHESFEDEALAALLNEHFVCIKVDREERPDLDQIYMQAVQLLTQRGGWPMSVFLTPDLQPFFGGTYWPPRQRMGMPGFDQVLAGVQDFWQNHRQQAVQQAEKLTEHLQQAGLPEGSADQLQPQSLQTAAAQLERNFDFTHGGFGTAPKFPHAIDLQLLLRIWRRHPREGVLEMVQLNLDRMAQGGIYDHLAGGFARYSVDEAWLVPHFEKMLYDNALLTGAYLDGYLVTGDENYARVARETLDYVLAYMTDPEGGFHSTEDADSEGEEGKFYVWTPAQVEHVLGREKGARFCYVYDVSDEGNFEGKSILNLPKTIAQCAALRDWDAAELEAELTESRAALLAVRDQRVRPGKDDKVLVSWNGLMIESLARAAGILQQPRYLEAATAAADFIVAHLTRGDGRLLHCWRQGQARFDAYLDDYSYLINALVTLYEAGFDERWIDEAARLADIVLQHFTDPERGGFYFTADDHEALIARHKDTFDSSVPASNAMAATALLRLGKLSGRAAYLEAAQATLEMAAGVMQQSPAAAGQMLAALDFWLGKSPEIAVLGDKDSPDTAALLADLRRRYIPNRVLACRATNQSAETSSLLAPLFAGKEPRDEAPTAYVCEGFTCQEPVSGRAAILAAWDDLAATK